MSHAQQRKPTSDAEPFPPLGTTGNTPAIVADELAERLVLGAILTDPEAFLVVAAIVSADDFSLEQHKRIFLRMGELHDRGEAIDRITVANELNRLKQLQAVGGLTYIVSLDENMPALINTESYARIVKEKANLRRIGLIAQDIQARVYQNHESASDLLGAAEEALLQLRDAQPRQRLYRPHQIIEEYDGGVNAFLDPSTRKQGIQTGFIRFDEMTGGFREGELIILAARPSVGKSAFAGNVATHIACHRDPNKRKAVLFFSLEMSKESLLTRFVCSEARVDQHRFRAGYVNYNERQALQRALYELSECPLYLDDTAGVTAFDVHSVARKLQKEADLGLVIVDYLQLLQARGKFENKVQEVSANTRSFKLASKDLKVPFLVLSQLSRAPETRSDHRPVLSDLRDSGSIEQDCDMAAFLYREELYKPDKESLKGVAELILAKQRNGNIGRIKMVFLGRYTKFENYAGDGDAEEPFEH
jgi:replicative DNA helicase